MLSLVAIGSAGELIAAGSYVDLQPDDSAGKWLSAGNTALASWFSLVRRHIHSLVQLYKIEKAIGILAESGKSAGFLR